MDFVGFLRFSLLCLDFLAWPAFALVYPLWASIRAIETSSKHHMKKLVTYWTIFSLISLFEIFFVKLIEWVPFWPYIKLVAICWLVIPQFNGACHVYQHLIHPCLSINPPDTISCSPKDKPYGEDSVLASAETYLKENGTIALEKLITSKGTYNKHIVNDADALEVIKRMEPTEENVTAEEQLVERPKRHPVESEKEVAAPEAQMVTIPAESKEKRLLEIHALKKVQTEWTCAVCQLTTESEATLNSHLLGEKHMSECEKLKISAQTTKNMQSSAAKDKSNTAELKTSRQTSNDLKSSAAKTNYSNQTKDDPKMCLPGERSKQNTTEKPKGIHNDAARGHQMQEKPKEMNASVKQQPKLWCGICNITCPGKIDMACHLKGRKHLESLAMQSNYSNQTKTDPKVCLPGERSKQNTTEKPKSKHIGAASEQQMQGKPKMIASVKQQPKFWCGVCNITCSGKIDMACHLKGRKHLESLAIQSNYSNQTKTDPKVCLPGERSKQNTTEKPKSKHIGAASEQQMQGKPKMIASVKQQPKFWCGVCNITCSGKIDMACHLKGQKHLFNIQMISSVGSGQA